MCWAGCARLAKIAARIGLADRARSWRARADTMHSAICDRAWNGKRKTFAATFGGEDLDASLLLLHRSEERRVGKECRSRWSAYHEKKKLQTMGDSYNCND